MAPLRVRPEHGVQPSAGVVVTQASALLIFPMRRFALLAVLFAAPLAVQAQTTPAPPTTSVPTDTLAARAVRAEGHFFAGRSADLRALADSAFSAAFSDDGHRQILAQVAQLGLAFPTGGWDTFEVQGMAGYRRAYTLGSHAATFLVVFDADGRVAGLALRPDQG